MHARGFGGRLQRSLIVLALAALAGCAQMALPPAAPPSLLQDAAFGPITEVPDAQALFQLSAEMREFADRELGGSRPGRALDPDLRRALIAALYNVRGLRLQYEGGQTRDAREAYEARAGNCLSLVIMTAAFAKHLDLPVSYQQVDAPAYYSRFGDLTLTSGHVNLVLAPPRPRGARAAFSANTTEALTIDFLPQDELRGQRTRLLDESTVVAMFLNNRAVELLASGHVAEAYAHSRAALMQEPRFAAAINTLGVIYNHANLAGPAERAFRHVLVAEPDNVSALSNLSRLVAAQGHAAEAAELTARLERLQPVTPFQQFLAGREAMKRGDYAQARDLFLNELRLQPFQDEVHFWAAQAYWRLGENERAARHLAWAAEYSPTRSEQARYAGKLAQLRAHTLQ
jgi:tetratricopeptide (TPR) repeat protein